MKNKHGNLLFHFSFKRTMPNSHPGLLWIHWGREAGTEDLAYTEKSWVPGRFKTIHLHHLTNLSLMFKRWYFFKRFRVLLSHLMIITQNGSDINDMWLIPCDDASLFSNISLTTQHAFKLFFYQNKIRWDRNLTNRSVLRYAWYLSYCSPFTASSLFKTGINMSLET